MVRPGDAPITELANVSAPFQNADITPDNRLAVMSVDDRVVAIDLKSGRVVHDLRGTEGGPPG